jgi:photosystem II stability/assembly factor-like uncharacterized protein
MNFIKSVMLSVVFSAICLASFGQTVSGQDNWSPVYRQTTGDLVSVFFTSSERGFIGGDGGFFAFTNNGGAVWTQMPLNTSENVNEIYFRNDDNGYLLAGRRVYITSDGGKSWRENRVLDNGSYAGLTLDFLSVRFADKRRGWIVGSVSNKDEEVVDSVVLHTVNSGETWQKVSVPTEKKELYGIDFIDESGWIVGDEGLVLKTEDDGKTWTKQNVGTKVPLFNVDFRDKKFGVIVGSRGTILRTENGGQTWEQVKTTATKSLLRVNFINDKTGWIVGNDGMIMKTDDKGKTWRKQESKTNEPIYGLYSDKRNSWVVGKKGLILKLVR